MGSSGRVAGSEVVVAHRPGQDHGPGPDDPRHPVRPSLVPGVLHDDPGHFPRVCACGAYPVGTLTQTDSPRVRPGSAAASSMSLLVRRTTPPPTHTSPGSETPPARPRSSELDVARRPDAGIATYADLARSADPPVPSALSSAHERTHTTRLRESGAACVARVVVILPPAARRGLLGRPERTAHLGPVERHAHDRQVVFTGVVAQHPPVAGDVGEVDEPVDGAPAGRVERGGHGIGKRAQPRRGRPCIGPATGSRCVAPADLIVSGRRPPTSRTARRRFPR